MLFNAEQNKKALEELNNRLNEIWDRKFKEKGYMSYDDPEVIAIIQDCLGLKLTALNCDDVYYYQFVET